MRPGRARAGSCRRQARIAFGGPVAAVLMLGVWAPAALAASFDCKKAASARERMVCSDAELSGMDYGVSVSFDHALARLSAAGGDALRKEQKAWLRYFDAACPARPVVHQTAPYDARSCVEEGYAARRSELDDTGVRHGPFVFTHHTEFGVSPLGDCDDESGPGLRHDYFSYPQVDAPIDETTRQWNELARKVALQLRVDGRRYSNVVGYSIQVANERLISVDWTTGYCNGTRIGGEGGVTQSTILRPHPRSLVPDDLFRPDTDWQGRLRALAIAAVRSRPLGEDKHFKLDEFAKVVADPSRWSFSAQGLAIRVYLAEFGLCDACTPTPDITIAWADLKPVLVANPPAP